MCILCIATLPQMLLANKPLEQSPAFPFAYRVISELCLLLMSSWMSFMQYKRPRLWSLARPGAASHLAPVPPPAALLIFSNWAVVRVKWDAGAKTPLQLLYVNSLGTREFFSLPLPQGPTSRANRHPSRIGFEEYFGKVNSHQSSYGL